MVARVSAVVSGVVPSSLGGRGAGEAVVAPRRFARVSWTAGGRSAAGGGLDFHTLLLCARTSGAGSSSAMVRY